MVGGFCWDFCESHASEQTLSTVVVPAMRCLAVLAVLVELLAAAGVTTAAGPSRDLLQTTRQFPQLTGSWPRLEISLLDRAPATDRYRNLFILSMRQLQRRPPSSPFSWFSLAQIHGANFKAYNNTFPPGYPQGYNTWGYCTHEVNIFITWHRAYLWHWERALKGAAMEVAASFVNPSERGIYRRLAERIRWPYLDWLHPYVEQSGLPKLLTAERVRVVQPRSMRPWARLQDLPNPLYAYRIQEALVDAPLPADTLPDPDLPVWSYPAGTLTNRSETYVRDLLDPIFRADQGQLWRTWLTTTSTWDCFSDTCSVLDEDQWDIAGLDAMHQTLHVIWGGGGDYPGMMTGIPFASFDPVFPVFHAYFDLLLHIWQQRNPDVWVDSVEYEELGAFYYPDDATLDATTPLAPFYSRRGDLINSNDVRNIRALGYFYATLSGTPLTINTAAASAVAAAAAAGVDPGTAALAVSDSVDAVATAARPAAGADAWASAITSMAPVGTYGWALNLPKFKFKRHKRPVYLVVFLEQGERSTASQTAAASTAAVDVAAATQLAATSQGRPARSKGVAVEGVVWGLPNARKGLTLTQLRKVPGFLAYSKLTTDGKERTTTVALTAALEKQGFNMSPVQTTPSLACIEPASCPISLQRLRVAAITGNGKDVTPDLRHGKVQLLWSCFSDAKQSTKLGLWEEAV